jgi:hypothetical protein
MLDKIHFNAIVLSEVKKIKITYVIQQHVYTIDSFSSNINLIVIILMERLLLVVLLCGITLFFTTGSIIIPKIIWWNKGMERNFFFHLRYFCFIFFYIIPKSTIWIFVFNVFFTLTG